MNNKREKRDAARFLGISQEIYMIGKQDCRKIIRIILPVLAVILAAEGLRYFSFFQKAYENIVFRKAFFTCIPLLIGISFFRIRKVLLASTEHSGQAERFCRQLNLGGYGALAVALLVLALV